MPAMQEFIDMAHKIADKYFDLTERLGEAKTGKGIVNAIDELRKFIKMDPDFFDTYILLSDLLDEIGQRQEAKIIMDAAYQRALEVITSEDQGWPLRLLWSRPENRHIIRALNKKAVMLWEENKFDEALELFGRIFRADLSDPTGIRNCLLGIRMGMSRQEYEKKFDKGGYFNKDIQLWFAKNYKKFTNEFKDWDEAAAKQAPAQQTQIK